MPANVRKGANIRTNVRGGANVKKQYNCAWFSSLSKTPNLAKGQAVSDIQLAIALRKSYGNRSKTAALLGVTPATIYNRVSASPALQQVMRDAAEQTIDLAEDVNLQAVRKGDDATAKWLLLNTRTGRDRGYGEKQSFTLTPTDVAAFASAFRGDTEALRGLDSSLDAEVSQEQGDPEADDRKRVARRPGKAAGKRGRKGVRKAKG